MPQIVSNFLGHVHGLDLAFFYFYISPNWFKATSRTTIVLSVLERLLYFAKSRALILQSKIPKNTREAFVFHLSVWNSINSFIVSKFNGYSPFFL